MTSAAAKFDSVASVKRNKDGETGLAAGAAANGATSSIAKTLNCGKKHHCVFGSARRKGMVVGGRVVDRHGPRYDIFFVFFFVLLF